MKPKMADAPEKPNRTSRLSSAKPLQPNSSFNGPQKIHPRHLVAQLFYADKQAYQCCNREKANDKQGPFPSHVLKTEAPVKVVLSFFPGIGKKYKKQGYHRRCAASEIKQEGTHRCASKSEYYRDKTADPCPQKGERKKEHQMLAGYIASFILRRAFAPSFLQFFD